MVITPQTEIKLLKCPLEADNLHQLKFANATAQYNYFNGLSNSLDIDNCTYARENGTLRIPVAYDTAIRYNYLMYQNEGYSNKWFYAFITDYTYLNNETTAITIKTDVYQTWQFDFTWKQCFIQREHVNNDTIGLHTIPENFELGELTCNDINRLAYSDLNLNTLLVMAVNKPLSPLTDSANTHMYGGVFSGLYYVAFHTPQDCAKCIDQLDGAGQGAIIENIFILPNKLLNITTWSTIYIPPATSSDTFEISAISNSNTPVRIVKDTIVTRNTTIDEYTPKNNKLFCWPFNYMLATNNSGQQTIYHYEDFANGNGDFDIVGTIAPGGSIRMIPRNYKNLGDDIDATACNNYGLSGAKYPICAWVNDAYTNWLTQNSVDLTIQYVGAAGQIAVGAGMLASGNIMGGVLLAGGAMQIGDELKALHQAEFMPNQASGSANSGDIQFSAHIMQFDVYQMSIKNEYAKIIDNYFNMFGYKVNRQGIPLENSRRYWNYIKTTGANIEGDDMPQMAINELKTIFDNGITLWHDPANIYNYNLNNTIV